MPSQEVLAAPGAGLGLRAAQFNRRTLQPFREIRIRGLDDRTQFQTQVYERSVRIAPVCRESLSNLSEASDTLQHRGCGQLTIGDDRVVRMLKEPLRALDIQFLGHTPN